MAGIETGREDSLPGTNYEELAVAFLGSDPYAIEALQPMSRRAPAAEASNRGEYGNGFNRSRHHREDLRLDASHYAAVLAADGTVQYLEAA